MARNVGARRRVGAETVRRAFNLRAFGEIAQELRRVTWPNRQETMRLTIMVLAVAGSVGVFLGLVDLGFGRLFNVILDAGP